MSDSAFEQLFRDHFAFVWRCVRVLGVSPADLDDMVQEVFVVVHRRLPDLNPELSVRAWLYGILRLVVQNQRRSARRSATRQQALQAEPQEDAPGPFETLQARQAAEQVNHILAQLEATRREVFLLVELEELSVPEAAGALGIPVNTAYSRLRLARSDFKAQLLRQRAS